MKNGIINVYKERGFTSFDVVAKLRGILHEKKIGHTGTLDPDATGVLPVCVGNATKVCALLTDKDKVYETVMHLGLTTDTLDASGTVLEDCSSAAAELSEETVRDVILQFVGTYDQVPPMYSALKVNGKKLCDLARAGVTVERKARTVTIFSIDITKMELPLVTMRVHCSKGTYIRSLCADIGERLGVGGRMDSLVRTRVSAFTLDNAHTLTEIEAYRDREALDEIMMPVDTVFEGLPKRQVKPEAVRLLQNGNRLSERDICAYICVDMPAEGACEADEAYAVGGRNGAEEPGASCVCNSVEEPGASCVCNSVKEPGASCVCNSAEEPGASCVCNSVEEPGASCVCNSAEELGSVDTRMNEMDQDTQKGWVLMYDDQGIFRAVYQHLPEAGEYKPVKMFL